MKQGGIFTNRNMENARGTFSAFGGWKLRERGLRAAAARSHKLPRISTRPGLTMLY